MGQIIDISGKFSREPKFIHLGENQTYKLDDRKNTIKKALLLTNKANPTDEDMDELVILLLGKEAYNEIEEMELSFADYQILIKALMATVSNVSYEEFEKRFQNA